MKEVARRRRHIFSVVVRTFKILGGGHLRPFYDGATLRQTRFSLLLVHGPVHNHFHHLYIANLRNGYFNKFFVINSLSKLVCIVKHWQIIILTVLGDFDNIDHVEDFS